MADLDSRLLCSVLEIAWKLCLELQESTMQAQSPQSQAMLTVMHMVPSSTLSVLKTATLRLESLREAFVLWDSQNDGRPFQQEVDAMRHVGNLAKHKESRPLPRSKLEPGCVSALQMAGSPQG